MFLDSQENKKKEYYQGMLGTLGSLSRLFSESNDPYIQYRIAENLFCKSFGAENLSRTDCSADASVDKLGIGIKTFLEKNGASMQKVAEFNGEHGLFKDLHEKAKILKVSELRNERIETTKRIFGLEQMIYHCVARKKGGIVVFESPMDLVDIKKIKKVKTKKNVISFEDGLNEYSFNITKSTLYKRFKTEKVLLDFSVDILENPFDALETLFGKTEREIVLAPIDKREHVFLPLYSMENNEKVVPEKSGLNMWNADGRPRNINEAYIRIPAWIHRAYPNFFPPRYEQFTLLLPNKSEMSASICQAGPKALMSNPNSALGEWLLRDVLAFKEGKLVTYDKLLRIGLDSVIVYKISEGKYDIDFTSVGSYEKFAEENISMGNNN